MLSVAFPLSLGEWQSGRSGLLLALVHFSQVYGSVCCTLDFVNHCKFWLHSVVLRVIVSTIIITVW